MKNLTIQRAAELLAGQGVNLIKGLPYDLQAMTARYEVEELGVRRVVTSQELKDIIISRKG